MHYRVRPSDHTIDIKEKVFLARGGEGCIYRISNASEFVAKIFHAESDIQRTRNENRKEKIECMIANTPANIRDSDNHFILTWPAQLVFTLDEPVEFKGYVMPYASGMRSIRELFSVSKRLQIFPFYTYRSILETAYNFVRAVEITHSNNIIIGDINGSNILVDASSRVTFVDTDSFQIEDRVNEKIYRCPVGKPEYTAPELQRTDYSGIHRKIEHDFFPMSIIMFLLLMEGHHPYDGIVHSRDAQLSLAEKIRKGYFPYSGARHISPMPSAPPFHYLHPAVQKLFLACFDTGHWEPSSRPNCVAWLEALRTALNDLIICSSNENHLYNSHLYSCPWCERKKFLQGLDPFPPHVDDQSNISDLD